MKKLLLGTNLVLLSFLLFSYSENEKLQNVLDPNIQLGVNPLLTKHMTSRYKADIWNTRHIEKKKYLDSRSVWFSIAKLKAFIADIESSSSNCSYGNDGFKLGIRFYFTNYPDTTKWQQYDTYFEDHKIPKVYGGLHTLLMVPTIWNPTDSFNYDFDPRRYDAAYRPLPISQVMDELLNPQKTLPPAGKPSSVPPNLSYSLTGDNLDNLRFIRSDNLARMMSVDDALTNYANGGTLIPPPYPPGTGAVAGAARMIGTSTPMINSFYVPYSGASFMRWVDGTNKCGWNTIDIKSKEAARKPTLVQ